MSLSDVTIRNAKPKEKPYKLSDEKGLYLLVNKAGKYFRFDYSINGRRNTLAIGVYPDTTLTGAREKHAEARKLVKEGKDPIEVKKALKQALIEATQNTFEKVALTWFNLKSHSWSQFHSKEIIRRLRKDVFPHVGGKNISVITSDELLLILQGIQDRGALETAHRVLQYCNSIFRFERVEKNPASYLSDRLKAAPKNKHYATITDEKKIGQLLRAIVGYEGYPFVKYALKLAHLVFVRPGELRQAEWSEFNLEGVNPEWRIPAEKMKMKQLHLVPLAPVVVSILMELKPITGEGKYLFPSIRTSHRCISNHTIN
ncbi:MAG: integrase arm-type DNA-binding domain-containing protein, partial [Nitrospirota bacterium]